MSSRLASVQMIRGVAALLVVGMHACNVAADARPAGWGESAIEPLFGHSQIGAVGVDLFFVLSGFVMALVAEQERTRPLGFLAARALRVAPPFWVASAAYGALLLASGRPIMPQGIVNTLSVVPIFDARPDYTLPPLKVGWTLAFEGLFYILVATALVLRPAGRRVSLLLPVLGGAGLVGLFGRGGFLLNPIIWEFAAGMFVYRLWARGTRRLAVPAFRFGIVILIGFGIYGPAFDTYPWLVIGNWTSGLRAAAWGLPCAMILYGATARTRSAGWIGQRLITCGEASFSLYLTHMLVMTSATEWAVRHPDSFPPDLLILLCMIAALVVGLAAYRWLERPWHAWSRRLIEQPSARHTMSVACSASTVSPRSLTSANPPSTWISAEGCGVSVA